MAAEVRTFAALIPAGTLITAPVTVAFTMPTRLIESVEILVPPGCNGLVGFAIAAAGQPVIPYGAGQWIIANGETIKWPIENQIQSGAWSLRGYNNGVYQHTLQVRFMLGLPVQPVAPLAPILPAALGGYLP